MRITRIGTRYIVLVWVLIILLLGTVLLAGYIRNMTDLRLLMRNEADQLIEIVTLSAQASIHSLDKIEDLTARRLLENARLLAHLAETRRIEGAGLEQIMLQNDLSYIEILDPGGSPAVSASLSGETARYPESLREAKTRVLEKRSDEELIGFGEGAYYTGQVFGVVVSRPGGGAVAVATRSDEMLEFRRAIGLGTLFAEIGTRAGVHYIVLQDTLGIVSASRNVTAMDRIVDDPFLVLASAGGQNTRRYIGMGDPVFEIVEPFVVDNVNLGLLRIGLDIRTYESIRANAIRQFLILFLAAVISGAFMIIFVIIRQNYRILDREHDRILMNVRRMEEETRRSERLASMGKFAGGVAHEIRNPLNAVSIITQRLASEFSPSQGAEEYRAFLNTIGAEIKRCPLGDNRNRFVFGQGDPQAGIMFIGEGPGAEEDRQGLPFVGRAGQLLTDMIKAIKLRREDVYIGNTVKCRPPANRIPEPFEIHQCQPILDRQIELIRPKIMCALGRTAALALMGIDSPLGVLRGRIHEYHGIPLIVTYHPAALLRNPGYKRDTWEDLKFLRREYDGLEL